MKIEELMNEHYSNLNENDLHILKYTLNNKAECCDLGINALAERCNVSRTTILRLAQKLGLSGYSEFKVCLKWEEKNETVEEQDYIDKIPMQVNETIKLANEKNYREICKLIHSADRVFIYGTGRAQQICCEELKRLFLFAHKYFNLIEGVTEFEALLPNLNQKDIVIIVSYSGNTPTLQPYLQQLSIKGINIVSITKMQNNKLASIAQHNLYGSSASINLPHGGIYDSTIFFYVIIEMLLYQYIKYINEL